MLAAVSTAVFFSTTAASVISVAEQNKVRAYNCRDRVVPLTADIKTTLDPETKTVRVEWDQGVDRQNVEMPYEPSTAFSGCSNGNKQLLRMVQQTYEREVRDTCTDFEAMVAGHTPIPEKNGVRGNLSAARSYIAQHCDR